MRVGVLTGGGDVPGLNSCIKAIVRRSYELGWEVLGFRRGWAGPLHVNPQDPRSEGDCLLKLNPGLVRTIDRTGGTILHTSRTNPGKVKEKEIPVFLQGRFEAKNGLVDCTPHVLEVLAQLKVDALIPIGGDDTLSYAARLAKEGVAVISVPKTMDNDVFGTDYCIGFSTAVARSVDFITALRTSAGSHERIAVVELFGRNSGETALIAGYLADADRVLIAEVPFIAERVAELLVKDRAANPSNYAMLVVSEGAQISGGGTVERGVADAYGHKKLGGIGEMVGAEITRLTGIGIISQSLAYLMRSGPPDSLDRMVATSYGIMAVQLLAKKQSGLMTAIRDGKYTTVPADTPIKGKRRVDVAALYDVQAYRPRIAEIENKPMFLY
jgi:6-phosphofructokinase 1